MAAVPNPFKPTAGALPPLLVGRRDIIDEFVESIEDGPGAPGRITIFRGPRGVGKTVMLTEVEDKVAQDYGWISISETATPGLVSRLTAAATRHLREFGAWDQRAVVSGTLPVVGGSLTLETPERLDPELGVRLNQLLDVLDQHGTGLLLTVDEVHRQFIDELRHLAATFQHLTREGRNVAIAMAGLPSAVSDLLNDAVLTFLRRATPVVLEDVPLDDVREAFAATISDQGRSITGDALEAATAATGGYPFMIQLVGHQLWRNAEGETIDIGAVNRAVPAARRRLGATVHATSLADLSEVDRTYLLAMARDDAPSSTGEVASRMGVTPHYASTYRGRLIDAGVIEPVGRGLVDFAIPYLREYLREHAAQYEMDSRRSRPPARP